MTLCSLCMKNMDIGDDPLPDHNPIMLCQNMWLKHNIMTGSEMVCVIVSPLLEYEL